MIAQRLRGIDDVGQEIPELVPKIQAAFDKLDYSRLGIDPIQIQDANGELRSTYDVLSDLQKVWGNINSMERGLITEAIAGNRQNVVLTSIMEGWSDVSLAIQNSENATGSAMAENEKYKQSVEGIQNQISSLSQQLSNNFFSADQYKPILTFFKDFLQVITNITGNKAVMTLLTGAGAWVGLKTLGAFFKTFKATKLGIELTSTVDGFGKLATTLINMPKILIGMAKGSQTAASAFTLLGGSATFAQAAITGIFAILTVSIAIFNQVKQAQEEARQKAIEYGNQAAEEVNTLRDLYNEYDRLGSIANRTTSEEEEFKNVQSQIIPLLGERTKALEGLTQGTNEYAEALKQLTVDEMQEKLRLLREGLIATKNELEASANVGLFGLGNKSVRFPAAYAKDDTVQGQVKQIMNAYMDSAGSNMPIISMPKDAAEQLEFYAAVQDSLRLLFDESERLRNLGDIAGADAIMEGQLYAGLQELSGGMGSLVDNAIRAKTQVAELEYVIANGMPDSSEEFESMRDAVWENIGVNEEYQDQVYQMINEMYPEWVSSVASVGEATAGSMQLTIEETERLTAVVNEAYNEITKLHSGYDILMQAADEFATTGALTAETMNSLASNGLLQYLTMVGDELVFNADALIADEEAARRNAEMTLKAGLAKDLYALATTGASDAEYYAAAGASSAAEGAAVMGQEFANSINGIVSAEVALRAFFATAVGKELSANAFAGKGRQVQQLVDTYNGAYSALQNIQSISSRDPFQGATRGAGSNAAATREATEAQREYREELERQKDVLEDQEDAINDLLEMTIKMIKKEQELAKEAIEQQIDDEKKLLDAKTDTLDKELDGYKKLIDARKELLQSQDEERDYQKELEERKTEISEMELRLLELSLDDSEANQKRRLELEDELAVQKEELAEYQHDRGIELAEDALDNEYTRFEELQQAKIDALEAEYEKFKEIKEAEIQDIETYLDREGQIRQDAIVLIEGRTQEFYDRLVQWNNSYSTGVEIDVKNAWDSAYNAMLNYNNGQILVIETLEQLKSVMSQLDAQIQAATATANSFNSAILGGGSGGYSGSSYSGSGSSSGSGGYKVVNSDGITLQGPYPTYEEAEKAATQYNRPYGTWQQTGIRIERYARGLVKASNSHYGITDEPWLGDEMIIKTANGSRLRKIEVGDSIIPANMTKTLMSFAKNPFDYLKEMFANNAPNVVNNQSGASIQIDASLNIAGNVDIGFKDTLMQMFAEQNRNMISNLGKYLRLS